MYTEVNTSNVPAFLSKLWTLVEDDTCDELICWDSTGESFHVYDQSRFAKEVLPKYFKHNNMASFIRQLNMYGFRKMVAVDQGLRSDRDDLHFSHPLFVRGHEELLEAIKRKVPSTRPEEVRQGTDVTRVLSDVRQMQGKQESMEHRIQSLKKENEILWREVANLRQRHKEQQQIVNKLIQFLVQIVNGGAATNISLKRKNPLMITEEDDEGSTSKMPKLKRPSKSKDNGNGNATGSFQDSPVDTGPVIHDITDLSDVVALSRVEQASMKAASDKLSAVNAVVAPMPAVKPGPSLKSSRKDIDLSSLLPSPGSVRLGGSGLLKGLPVLNEIAAQTSPDFMSDELKSDAGSLDGTGFTKYYKDMFGDHLESMQSELDSLRDMLTSENYALEHDQDSLMDLFSSVPLDVTNETNALNDADDDAADSFNEMELKPDCGGNPSFAGSALIDNEPIVEDDVDLAAILGLESQ